MKRLFLVLLLVVAVFAAGHAHAFEWGTKSSKDVHASRVLYQSAVPVSVGGTVAETTLMSVTLPPLRVNDALRVSYVLTYTGSTNNKTIRAKLGGVQLYGSIRNSGTVISDNMMLNIWNRGATGSQVFTTNYALQQTSAPSLLSADTSTGAVFTLTGQSTLETGFTPTQANMSGSGSVVTVTYTSHGLNTGEYVQAAGSSTSGYNVDPVQVTVVNANSFTYPGSGTGTPTTSPTIKRYSVIKLESCTVELLPSVN